MKKIILFLGMLLSLGLFSACSSDDGIDNDSSDDYVDLTPVDEGDDLAALFEFFQTEIGPDGYGGCATGDEKPFNLKNNLRKDENPCLVINNEEDFKEAYTGDLSLPTLDFSKYTLIIGKVYLSAGTFIDNISIRQTNSTKATLYIKCIQDTNGAYLGVMYYEYYWKLYPKFHASEINVEISREKGEVDDSKRR